MALNVVRNLNALVDSGDPLFSKFASIAAIPPAMRTRGQNAYLASIQKNMPTVIPERTIQMNDGGTMVAPLESFVSSPLRGYSSYPTKDDPVRAVIPPRQLYQLDKNNRPYAFGYEMYPSASYRTVEPVGRGQGPERIINYSNVDREGKPLPPTFLQNVRFDNDARIRELDYSTRSAYIPEVNLQPPNKDKKIIPSIAEEGYRNDGYDFHVEDTPKGYSAFHKQILGALNDGYRTDWLASANRKDGPSSIADYGTSINDTLADIYEAAAYGDAVGTTQLDFISKNRTESLPNLMNLSESLRPFRNAGGSLEENPFMGLNVTETSGRGTKSLRSDFDWRAAMRADSEVTPYVGKSQPEYATSYSNIQHAAASLDEQEANLLSKLANADAIGDEDSFLQAERSLSYVQQRKKELDDIQRQQNSIASRLTSLREQSKDGFNTFVNPPTEEQARPLRSAYQSINNRIQEAAAAGRSKSIIDRLSATQRNVQDRLEGYPLQLGIPDLSDPSISQQISALQRRLNQETRTANRRFNRWNNPGEFGNPELSYRLPTVGDARLAKAFMDYDATLPTPDGTIVGSLLPGRALTLARQTNNARLGKQAQEQSTLSMLLARQANDARLASNDKAGRKYIQLNRQGVPDDGYLNQSFVLPTDSDRSYHYTDIGRGSGFQGGLHLDNRTIDSMGRKLGSGLDITPLTVGAGKYGLPGAGKAFLRVPDNLLDLPSNPHAIHNTSSVLDEIDTPRTTAWMSIDPPPPEMGATSTNLMSGDYLNAPVKGETGIITGDGIFDPPRILQQKLNYAESQLEQLVEQYKSLGGDINLLSALDDINETEARMAFNALDGTTSQLANLASSIKAKAREAEMYTDQLIQHEQNVKEVFAQMGDVPTVLDVATMTPGGLTKEQLTVPQMYAKHRANPQRQVLELPISRNQVTPNIQSIIDNHPILSRFGGKYTITGSPDSYSVLTADMQGRSRVVGDRNHKSAEPVFKQIAALDPEAKNNQLRKGLVYAQRNTVDNSVVLDTGEKVNLPNVVVLDQGQPVLNQRGQRMTYQPYETISTVDADDPNYGATAPSRYREQRVQDNQMARAIKEYEDQQALSEGWNVRRDLDDEVAPFLEGEDYNLYRSLNNARQNAGLEPLTVAQYKMGGGFRQAYNAIGRQPVDESTALTPYQFKYPVWSRRGNPAAISLDGNIITHLNAPAGAGGSVPVKNVSSRQWQDLNGDQLDIPGFYDDQLQLFNPDDYPMTLNPWDMSPRSSRLANLSGSYEDNLPATPQQAAAIRQLAGISPTELPMTADQASRIRSLAQSVLQQPKVYRESTEFGPQLQFFDPRRYESQYNFTNPGLIDANNYSGMVPAPGIHREVSPVRTYNTPGIRQKPPNRAPLEFSEGHTVYYPPEGNYVRKPLVSVPQSEEPPLYPHLSSPPANPSAQPPTDTSGMTVTRIPWEYTNTLPKLPNNFDSLPPSVQQKVKADIDQRRAAILAAGQQEQKFGPREFVTLPPQQALSETPSEQIRRTKEAIRSNRVGRKSKEIDNKVRALLQESQRLRAVGDHTAANNYAQAALAFKRQQLELRGGNGDLLDSLVNDGILDVFY